MGSQAFLEASEGDLKPLRRVPFEKKRQLSGIRKCLHGQGLGVQWSGFRTSLPTVSGTPLNIES